jgi:hypothetical protein
MVTIVSVNVNTVREENDENTSCVEVQELHVKYCYKNGQSIRGQSTVFESTVVFTRAV